jgi:predicted amidohydrolase YtcJ
MAHGADLVVTGADIYPVARLGGRSPSPRSALAVRDGLIVAIGTESSVREQVGPKPNHLHLPGKLVIPGFQDAHVHAPFAGRNRLHLDLSRYLGLPAYVSAVATYAAEHPSEPWIVGGGWAMEYFPGGEPNRSDLDRVVPDRPVFLFNRDVHGAWVNSAALRLAGIDRDTPDPPDGSIVRDPDTGEPTGSLHEGAAYRMNDSIVPQPPRDVWEASILEAQRHLFGLGITGWQDAWVTPHTHAAYRALADSGALRGRVVGALWWDRDRGLEQIPELVEQRELGVGTFHPGTVKIMIDGVLETRSGAVLEPYCGDAGHGGHQGDFGHTFVEPTVLQPAVAELDRLGFQVHMHAIGDAAVRHALDAVEQARAENGSSDNRHQIAHLQLVHPTDIARFRELGVVANCQAYWAQSEPQMEELTIPLIGAERAGRQYPFGDLERSGATLAMGSDWGVTTADPLEQIEVAVTRIDPENRSNPPFLPEQRLSLASALAAFTMGSAYANHDDTEAGSLEVGKRADFAVVDRNLMAVPTGSAGYAGDARVTHTFVRGELVHGPV